MCEKAFLNTSQLPSGAADPAEDAVKHQQADQADPEHRHRIADQRHNPRDLVHPCAAFHGRQHTERHADDDAHEGADRRQLHRGGKYAFYVVDHRKAGAKRYAEIALDDIAQIQKELHDQGFIQPQRAIGVVIDFLAGAFADNGQHRIDGHHPTDKEGHKQKPEHGEGNCHQRFGRFYQEA